MESLKSQIPSFVNEDLLLQSTKTSCISGRENLTTNVDKPKQQFRYNRVRLVPDDWPEHGRREVNILWQ